MNSTTIDFEIYDTETEISTRDEHIGHWSSVVASEAVAVVSPPASFSNLVNILIERELPKLRRFAWMLVRDNDRADDLLQDTIVRVLAYAERWEPGTNFCAWVRAIMRNELYSERRRSLNHRSALTLEDAPEPAAPPSQMAQIECREWEATIAGLPECQRTAIMLAAFDGLQSDEIARRMHISSAAVRCHLLRGRKVLREIQARERADMRPSGKLGFVPYRMGERAAPTTRPE